MAPLVTMPSETALQGDSSVVTPLRMTSKITSAVGDLPALQLLEGIVAVPIHPSTDVKTAIDAVLGEHATLTTEGLPSRLLLFLTDVNTPR